MKSNLGTIGFYINESFLNRLFNRGVTNLEEATD
jgi:hypothetical protein